MRKFGLLTYGAAIAGTLLLMGRESTDAGNYVFQRLPLSMATLGISGWLIATLGPIALSISVFGLAQRLRSAWIFHLIFIPVALGLYQAGSYILFYAADVPDGDSIEGYALILGFGFLVITWLVHVTALASAVARIVRMKAQ